MLMNIPPALRQALAQQIAKLESEQRPPLDTYRHILPDGADMTLCGYTEDDADRITLACDCGSPDCGKPANCPACLSVKNGRLN